MEEIRRTDDAERSKPLITARAVEAALICVGLAIVIVAFGDVLHSALSEKVRLTAHITLEFMSIVLCYVIFAVGWYGYKQNRNSQDLVTGTAFAVIGALIYAHSLAEEGILPTFLTANTRWMAVSLWVAMTVFQGQALLVAALTRPDSRGPWLKPRVLMSAGVVTTLVLVVQASYIPPSAVRVLLGPTGWTLLAYGLIFTGTAACVLAVFAVGNGPLERGAAEFRQIGLVIGAFSGPMGLLGTSSPTAPGWSWYVLGPIAYYFILRSLVASSFHRPYVELDTAQRELSTLVKEVGELYRQSDEQRVRLKRSFTQIGAALRSSLEIRETLRLIGELAADMIGAEAAAVAVREEERPALGIVASRGLAENQIEIPLEGSHAAEAMRQGVPQLSDETSTIAQYWRPELVSGVVSSSLTVPMVLGDRVLGALSLYSSKPRAFSKDDADLVGTFAEQAAVAVDNAARYVYERRIAHAFQQGLMPKLPDVEHWDLAARYEPASPTAEVGGDLYDVVLLDSSRLALAIGDVCGKGLDAAVVMASIQYMTRGFLFQGMQPAQILSGLHSALVRQLEASQFATMFLSVLNVETGELAYSNAGHPFPVLVGPGGCRTMSGSNGGPVGAFGSGDYKTDTLLLAGWGATKRKKAAVARDIRQTGLLMYTDGLIEARRGKELFGERRVLEVCNANLAKPAGELVDELLVSAREFGSGNLSDDIALLAVMRSHG